MLCCYVVYTVVMLQGKRREGSNQAVFYHSFISGCIAGSFASLSVNPFDGRLKDCYTISVSLHFSWVEKFEKKVLN